MTLTYAPNARVLNAARAITEHVSSESLLAIADPQPVSATPLDNAGD